MIITLTRSGGFTGIPLKKIIDTKTLDPQKAEEIESLITKSNYCAFQQEQVHRYVSTKPDRFTYTISVENGAISHTIELPEIFLPPELQKFINYVKDL